MSLPVDEDDITMVLTYSPSVNEWMRAIRRPTQYRVGTAKFNLKPRLVIYAAVISVAVLILLLAVIPNSPKNICPDVEIEYNDSYPLSHAVYSPIGRTFKLGLVADLDLNNKDDMANTWFSYFKTGNFIISHDNRVINVEFNKPIVIKSSFSNNGRGMELSELVVFNGKLFSIDDRTGIIYEHVNEGVVPWVILSDGNGKENNGNFSCYTVIFCMLCTFY